VKRLAGGLAAALALLAAPGSAQAAVPPGCATTESPGGEWRTYGHDYSNTRVQDHEKSISPADVPTLSPAWTFSTVQGEGDQRSEGDITGTPIVADGCVYVGTNRGWAFALNADTGELVWKTKVPYGGGINSSANVTPRVCGKKKVRWKKVRVKRKGRDGKRGRDGKKRKWKWKYRYKKKRCGTVFFGISRTKRGETCPEGQECTGPYVIALNQRDGSLAWTSPTLDTQPGSDLYDSPVILDGMMLIGVSGGAAELGDEQGRYAFQGSMNFLGTRSGRVLKKTYTIQPPQDPPPNDYAGAGIWSSAAIDPEQKVAWVGGSNPFRPQAEHEHANAILKFDIDRKSPTFGEIVAAGKGNNDEYVEAFSQLPCIADIPGNPPPYYPQGIGACQDIDLSFGASPNLWTDKDGRQLIGGGQKSGVYHVFDAKTMEPVFNQVAGAPTPVGGIVGSTAHDGENVYGPVTVPGYLWSISAANGAHRWFAPIGDGAHWGPPVAVANGVVYSVDTTGFFNAADARTGAILAKRPLPVGGSGPVSASWGGVSVARNTIFASVGITSLEEGYVVAYRPGGPSEAVEDLQNTPGNSGGDDGGGGGGGEGGSGSAIVAGPGSTYASYYTPVMTTQVGGPVSFMNSDLPQHDVVADEKAPDGSPLFSSKLVGVGEVTPVEGLDRVQAGKSYGFYCSIHPGMRGTLIVR
jgi:polyvinyl alcohol dehydrogenase (cytochrome)